MRTVEMPSIKPTGNCRISRLTVRAVFLMILSLMIFAVSGADHVLAVEFVTRQAFEKEKDAYKDYPLRVLFEKLNESREAEKRAIRNVIILKQVFDPKLIKRATEAGVALASHYGVVKEVTGDRLRFWIPESGNIKTFHVGIDRIPLINDRDYDISPLGIDKFAAIAHVLDDRIYKIEVKYLLAPPSDLRIQRRGEKNIIGWREPKTEVKPIKYKVFVNKHLFKTVERASVEVPRRKDRADEFFVKAVYVHQNGIIDSVASTTLYDQATADEIGQRQQAELLYGQILRTLNPSEWQDAKTQLYQNRHQMETHLDADKRTRLQVLSDFFREIDEGDRLRDITPQTQENLAEALASYKRAEKKAAGLPGEIAISFVYKRKIDALATAEASLVAEAKRQKAEKTFAVIISSLSGQKWQDAIKMLADNRSLLDEHLNADQKTAVNTLAAVFSEIDAGNRTAAIRPLTVENLQSAIAAYRRAEEKAQTLPAGVDAGFIPRLRITDTQNRIQLIKTGQQKQLAQDTYLAIKGALTASEWQNARTSLVENRTLLDEHLNDDQKIAVKTLDAVFKEIDAGDRTAAIQPSNIDTLKAAMDLYREADRKARTLPEGVDAALITRIKIEEIQNRMTEMESGIQKRIAEKTYLAIIGNLTPDGWPSARKMLTDNRSLLDEHLDYDSKAIVISLETVLNKIAAGDRMASVQPSTIDDLKAAISIYREAGESAGTLPSGADAGPIVQLKIGEVQNRIRLIETGMQKRFAEKTYLAIIGNLTPDDWPSARKTLYDNRDLLNEYLDADRKAGMQTLAEMFKEIESADRTAGTQPVTIDNLNSALALYRWAEAKAKTLPGDVKAGFIVKLKIDETKKQMMTVETGMQKQLAEKTYRSIIGQLNTSEWQKAGETLNNTRNLLDKHLGPVEKDAVSTLDAVFNEIETGDRTAAIQPATLDTLQSAMAHYQGAEETANALPSGVDAGLIARLKISELQNRIGAIETGIQKQVAEKTYLSILGNLSPDDWQNARKTLSGNRALLSEHLNSSQQEILQTLDAIFNEIGTGDRTAAIQPLTMDNLRSAIDLYQAAGEKAKNLPAGVDAGLIAQLRISETRNRIRLLETGKQKQFAQQTYHSMLARLTPEGWKMAEKTLSDNRDLFGEHLNTDQNLAVQTLEAVFKEIDAGDRTAAIQPPTAENLLSAIALYEKAGEKAAALPPGVDTGLIVRLKVGETRNRIQQLETGKQRQFAKKTYQSILGSLSASNWQGAGNMLSENRALLDEHLDAEEKGAVKILEIFFKEMAAGEQTAAIHPLSLDNLKTALAYYRKAEEIAQSLPAGVAAGVIAELKVNRIQGRIERIQTGKQKQYAEKQYERILVSMNPSDWETARSALYDQHLSLTEHLDEDKRKNILELIAFFKDIDEGDRLSGGQNTTLRDLTLADRFYQRAAQKAKMIQSYVDVGFIAQLKIEERGNWRAALEEKQQKTSAGKIYEKTVAMLIPDRWKEAKKLLGENQMLMLEHLDPARKEDVLGLIAFFRDLAEGDRLADQIPETEKNLQTALSFYDLARLKAVQLEKRLKILFIADDRIGIAKNRIDLIGRLNQQQLAEKTYDQIMEAFNPDRWQAAGTLLTEKKALLLSHLAPDRQANVEGLLAFFSGIDEGDRFMSTPVQTVENLEKALARYELAGMEISEMAGIADHTFILDQKRAEVQHRREVLTKEAEKREIGQVYERIISSLTPDKWASAKSDLAANESRLFTHLAKDQKQQMSQLISFFQYLEEGDRLMGEQPESREKMEMALSSYRLAEQKLQAIPGIGDLSFITEEKIKSNEKRRADLEVRRKGDLAGKIYDEMTAALTPDEWETAKELAIKKLKLLTDYLDPERQETAKLLIDFFADIDESDNASYQRPESVENYDRALVLLQQAEEKAISLSNRVDVMFISESKTAEIDELQEALAAREQAIIDAQQQAQQVAAAPAPVRARVAKTEAFDDSVDPQTALKRAVAKFDARNYHLSLRYFLKVYEKQIQKLAKGGKKQVLGLLALPPAVRAEVTFLVQLVQLIKKSKGDEDLLRDGLQGILDNVDSSSGPWSIIPEAKKNRIRRHINNYRF